MRSGRRPELCTAEHSRPEMGKMGERREERGAMLCSRLLHGDCPRGLRRCMRVIERLRVEYKQVLGSILLEWLFYSVFLFAEKLWSPLIHAIAYLYTSVAECLAETQAPKVLDTQILALIPLPLTIYAPVASPWRALAGTGLYRGHLLVLSSAA